MPSHGCCQKHSLGATRRLHHGIMPPRIVFGIDFTKSNEWTGKFSFKGRNLHHIGDSMNHYEEVIAAVGEAYSPTGSANSIQIYGFGDETSTDKEVFEFLTPGHQIEGFSEAIGCYRETVPQIKLAGPTSFAPVIEMAMSNVSQSGGQYHVLIIIADGQITRGSDIKENESSPQERETLDAIQRARKYPLSVFLIGVGDQGNWRNMDNFMRRIPKGGFNNFEYVNFTDIISKKGSIFFNKRAFARVMMEKTLEQYQEILNILGVIGDLSWRNHPVRVPLAGPIRSFHPPMGGKNRNVPLLQPMVDIDPLLVNLNSKSNLGPSTEQSTQDRSCIICFTNPKDMAFGCGHQVCCECGTPLYECPICRGRIETRIKLYLDS